MFGLGLNEGFILARLFMPFAVIGIFLLLIYISYKISKLGGWEKSIEQNSNREK